MKPDTQRVKQEVIPILITWDVDPDRWTTLEKRQDALSRALNICEESSIKSTFFFTANFAHEYPAHIQRMKVQEQEIGCHGLNHTDEEEYDRMPGEIQRIYIADATRKLELLVNSPIRAFRSPRVKTSFNTLRFLSEYGYWSDSSVCSQRMDFLSSNLINPGWLTAPRLPYHPHRASAFKRGDLPIWEIPISAMAIPLISGSLNVFGLPFMKTFFHLLCEEAKRTGKPIVYLSHPTDLLPTFRRRDSIGVKQFSFASIRTHGFLFRRIFFRMNGEALFQATRQLFKYMASYQNVRFMTVSEYVINLNSFIGGSSS